MKWGIKIEIICPLVYIDFSIKEIIFFKPKQILI